MRGRIRVRILVATWALASFCVYASLLVLGRDTGGAAVLVALVAGALVAS